MRTNSLFYLHCGSRPRSRTGRPLILAAMAFVIALSGTMAWSQVHPHGAYGPVSGTDLVLQRMVAARAEFRDTETALDTLTQKIRKRLETEDPEWVNRSQAAHSAEIERDRVRGAVLAALKAKPAYVEAQDAEAKAQERLRKLTDAHVTSVKECKAADDRDYAMRNKIHEMEQQALQDSPELRAAETNVRETGRDVNDHWARYVTSVLVTNPTWTQAMQRRDEAAARVKAAEAAFVESRRQAAQTRARGGSSRSGGSNRGNSWSSRSRQQ